MNTQTFPGIITQDQFLAATSWWRNVINSQDAGTLQKVFDQNGKTAASVRFPAAQIIKLISTVGMQAVKVKFGIVPDTSTGDPRFALLIFAADGENLRISSYYVSQSAAATSTPDPQTGNGLPTGEVPNVLAQTWMTQWADLGQVEPSLFVTNYGALQGYTFDADDFVDTLFHVDSIENAWLNVYFGLHKYYQDGPTGPAEASTFGLVLQMDAPGSTGGSDPFMDLSMPLPADLLSGYPLVGPTDGVTSDSTQR